MLDDGFLPRAIHPDAYTRTPVTDTDYIHISTACKRCDSKFVGNAEEIVNWENVHFDKCGHPMGKPAEQGS